MVIVSTVGELLDRRVAKPHRQRGQHDHGILTVHERGRVSVDCEHRDRCRDQQGSLTRGTEAKPAAPKWAGDATTEVTAKRRAAQECDQRGD
jgi:hypothetical protein